MGSSEIITVAALILTIVCLYLNHRGNQIQQQRTLGLEEANQIALSQGGNAIALPPSEIPASGIKATRWSIAALGILLVMNLVVTAVDYYVRRPMRAGDWGADYIGKTPPKREWHNEIVPLDGFNYQDCTMDNVTFNYEGTTPIMFSHNHVNGYPGFKSGDIAIGDFVMFLAELRILDPRSEIYIHPLPGARTDVPHKEIRP